MSVGSGIRRAGRLIVHNWPLKLAAIALATLLYAGLVASQDSTVFPGPVPVTAVNQPPGTVVTNDLRDIEQIRYIAPLEVGRLRAEDFEATVDLTNVKPDGQQVNVRVAVNAIDPRVTILDSQPRSIQVVLDEVTSKLVDVDVQQATHAARRRCRRHDVHAAAGHGHRPVHRREPRRVGARDRAPGPGGDRRRPRLRGQAGRRRGRRRGGRRARPALGPRDDPAVHQPRDADPAGEPERDRHPRAGLPDRVDRVRSADRVRRGRCRPARPADAGRHGAGAGLGRHPRRRPERRPRPAVGRGRRHAGDGARGRPYRGRDRDPHLPRRDPARRPRARARLHAVGDPDAAHAVRPRVGPRPPRRCADRRRRQRRGPRAWVAHAAGGPIVALDRDPRGGVARDRHRHDLRAGDAHRRSSRPPSLRTRPDQRRPPTLRRRPPDRTPRTFTRGHR